MMFDYKCVGLDIFVITPSGLPKVPENCHNFKLELISQRGMRCWPGPMPDGISGNWFHCRYRGNTITDESIKALLLELEKTVIWEKVQKLWQKDGVDLFSKAYEA